MSVMVQNQYDACEIFTYEEIHTLRLAANAIYAMANGAVEAGSIEYPEVVNEILVNVPAILRKLNRMVTGEEIGALPPHTD